MKSEEQALIRELFLYRKKTYSLVEASRLTCSQREDLLSVAAPSKGNRIDWPTVAHLALDRWTPRQIELVLGLRAHEVIPPLNRHEIVRVSLPTYQIRLLHLLATSDSRRLAVSDVIEQQLLDVVSAVATDEIEGAFPGFTAALHSPSDPITRSLRKPTCVYCGGPLAHIAITCPTCDVVHDPRRI